MAAKALRFMKNDNNCMCGADKALRFMKNDNNCMCGAELGRRFGVTKEAASAWIRKWRA